MKQTIKHYYAGPTAVKFHADDSFVRGFRGPVGSGKSVACCMEIVARAARQRPNAEGNRLSRWAIVRNTYGELKTTTIKTWQQWVSDDACPIVYDAPIRGTLKQELDDGTTVILEVLFVALDQPKHVKKLLSLELTGAWINEAREVPKAILDGLTMRVGRYPGKIDGGASWRGIILDTNPPDDDHWWYKLAEEETPRGYSFYKQPPALLYNKERGYYPNKKAENVKNLEFGYEYYLQQIPGKTREWIKVYVMGDYGNVQEGKPVYPEYNDDIHCSRIELEPVTSLPLLLGFDFGLTPSCIFGQITPRGRLLAIDELISENMGIKQFVAQVVKPHLNQHYADLVDHIIVVGDPAGNQRAQTDETTCLEELRTAGFKDVTGASTNSFIARREAVASYLTSMSDGQPCFYISPKCKVLRRGFLGGYKYRRIQVSGDERFTDQPDKNAFSHPHDALQYLALRAQMGVRTIKDIEEEDMHDEPVQVAGMM